MASDIIQSRADFFRVLDEALKGILERLTKAPNFDPYQIIENELDAMKRWTVNGRTPTPDEREWVDIGVITIRELEPANTPEEYDFNNLLHELDFYFSNWPDDPDVAAEFPPIV